MTLAATLKVSPGAKAILAQPGARERPNSTQCHELVMKTRQGPTFIWCTVQESNLQPSD